MRQAREFSTVQTSRDIPEQTHDGHVQLEAITALV
jgi:hypothetical protein